MAIVIPSSKTYNRQNPKVRDNVIERIEVGTVDVVPDNEYETPVYNEKVFATQQNIYPTTVDNQIAEGMQFAISGGGYTNSRRSASYVGYLEQKTLKTQIKIPVTKDNKYISALLTGINEENKEENIKYSLYGVEKVGSCSASWDYSVPSTAIQITIGEINYSPPTEISVEKSIVLPPQISTRENSDSQNQVSSSAKQSIKKWGNIETAKADLQTIGKKDYYILNLEIPCGVKTVGMTHFDNISTENKYHSPPEKLSFNGSYTIYEPTQVEITVYGNTIGIDLTDKTVYINGETQKKVHSVDGNELMQTSNYFSYSGENAIESMFGLTQGKYKQGKETATIRCSISDYYNYEDNSLAINSNKKNIISYPYLFGKKQTFHGITATDLGNGAILLQGTNTLGDYLFIDLMNKKIEEIVEDFVATSANNPNTKYGYTISMGQSPNSEYNGIAIGYTVNNNITWLRIDPYKEINITIYPMINKGGEIPFENPITPMCFLIGDKVIPMVYGADGKDRPMSNHQNGSAKVFQVFGIKIYYDGAVWQELSLQEV